MKLTDPTFEKVKSPLLFPYKIVAFKISDVFVALMPTTALIPVLIPVIIPVPIPTYTFTYIYIEKKSQNL